jgi:hypothetical protein
MTCKKLVVLVGVLCVLGSAAVAGEGAEPGDVLPVASSFSLDWDSGNLKDLMDYTVQVVEGELSVALGPGVGELHVPSLRLRNTNVFLLASLLPQVVPGLHCEFHVGNTAVDVSAIVELDPRAIEVTAALIRKHGPPTLVLTAVGGATPSRSVKAYSVDRILRQTQIKIEELAETMTTASTMASGTPAELKFHPKTSVLICSGDSKQLKAVGEVHEAMSQSAHARNQVAELQFDLSAATRRAKDLTEEVSALTMDLRFRDAQIARLEVQVAALQRELERANDRQRDKSPEKSDSAAP